jgi:ankyrin repeat protein/ketosteroid isomerase-like protein
MDTQRTETIIRAWFDAIGRGDTAAVMAALAPDIEFILPKDRDDQIIPYVGIMHGREEVAQAFATRAETNDILDYGLRDLVAEDDRAIAIVYTKARQKESGVIYEIEDAHHLTVNAAGQIKRWAVYFDPDPETDAYRVPLANHLIAACWRGDVDDVRTHLDNGADARTRDEQSGLTVLQIAAGVASPELVKVLLEAGADVHTTDSRAGGSALHKACQGGSVEVVKLLLDAGAFVDTVAPTTGHTPLMDALWFKFPEIVQVLLDRGATLNLSTHYGFSLWEHLKYELNVNTRGKELLVESDGMVERRNDADKAAATRQVLMQAVVAKDLAAVDAALKAGADVNERFPLVNGFNDGHTPLHVASRDGTPEIVARLLQANPDVNAVEPCFQAVPLHKAVYNGHTDITRLLVAHPGIDINFQGGTNGYSSLHDSLWHGYDECADILVEAGARLDTRGHDGKTPLDLATEVLGADHPVTAKIRARVGAADAVPASV